MTCLVGVVGEMPMLTAEWIAETISGWRNLLPVFDINHTVFLLRVWPRDIRHDHESGNIELLRHRQYIERAPAMLTQYHPHIGSARVCTGWLSTVGNGRQPSWSPFQAGMKEIVQQHSCKYVKGMSGIQWTIIHDEFVNTLFEQQFFCLPLLEIHCFERRI